MRNSLIFILIWLSASCATKVVSTKNFSIAPEEPTTFLVQPSYNRTSLSVENRQLDEQLQQVIEEELIKKGLRVASTPDLYVSYKVNVYTSSEVRDEYDYPYCGDDFMYPYNYSATENEEGVLIIVLKNHVGDLVWQGTKPFSLTSIMEAQEMLPNICRKIIRTYNYNI